MSYKGLYETGGTINYGCFRNHCQKSSYNQIMPRSSDNSLYPFNWPSSAMGDYK
jgi:hypothetical protein